MSKYDHEYISVSTGHKETQKLLRKASEILYVPSDDRDLADEQIVINELIENFDALSLVAGIIACDGIPVAYSIGEKMSEDTALIHIEKANRAYSGAYAAINKLFAEKEFSDTKFINREEDMGIEGLRKAKLSYRPIHLGEYYTVIL